MFGASTPMTSAPAAATLDAGTVAWSCVAESKDVVIPVLLSVISSPVTKPTPVAVSVKAALPAATDAGEMEVRLNVVDPAPVTANSIAFEVVVSGFIALMLTVPAVAICAADIVVVS